MGFMSNVLIGRPFWRWALVISIFMVFFVAASGMLGTGILAPRAGWGEGFLFWVDHIHDIEGNGARWDASYYLKIAQHGYAANGMERAFFPLYPLTVRALASLLHISLLWSGIIVSITCFVAASVLVYLWAALDNGHRIALWTVIWLSAFPMAMFFIAIYAEALFLLLTIAALYFSRRGQFLLGGLAIGLAGAARPLGFLLAIPYLIEFWQQHNFSLARWAQFGMGSILAPLGTLAYLAYLGTRAHTANFVKLYSSLQAGGWDRFTTWPWVTAYDGLRAALFGTGINPDWFSRSLVWHDLIYAILLLIAVVWGFTRLRLSNAVFLAGSTLFLFTQHGPAGYAFWSLPRYTATLVPIFLVLALWADRLPRLLRWSILAVSIGLLGLMALWFTSGRWVS